MTRYTTTDVLICGAGVTGLTLAIELARHGVSFRLIEKRATPFIGSRGKGIQPRTQEIFEDLGILNKVVAAGGLYPRLRTYRHDGSYVDSDIAHHTKPTHAEPYHLPLMPGCQLLPILMLKQLFPSPLIYLILMLHLSIFINHTVGIGPLHSTPTTSKA